MTMTRASERGYLVRPLAFRQPKKQRIGATISFPVGLEVTPLLLYISV